MKRHNGDIYYTIKEASIVLGKSVQALRDWIHINHNMIKQGKEGIVPEVTIICDKQYFSEIDIKQIRENMKCFKRGDFTEFRDAKTTYKRLQEENARLKRTIDKFKGGDYSKNY